MFVIIHFSKTISSMKFVFLFWIMVIFQVGVKSQVPAFPGAEGFGAKATGGRGGKVIYVTNLNINGAGSLQAALNESGKRYILFKVSGVIPGTVEVPNGHGDFTLAGQTSPSGIIVRGFQSYNGEDKSSSNMIIRHLRSRIGDIGYYPTPHWLGSDGLTLGGVHNTIVDRCSFAHANDEAVDISRSSALSIQNCILAETLGGHSSLGGMLINYSSPTSRLDSLSIHHNIWNRIGGRMPEISCETPFCNGKIINIELSNNIFWDPRIELWYEGVTGNNGFFNLRMNAINNYSYASTSYGNGMFHFDLLNFPQNELFFSGNQMNLYPQYKDYELFYCCNDFNLNKPNSQNGSAKKTNSRFGFPTVTYHSLSDLKTHIFKNAGAFPRDKMDLRLMSSVQMGTIDTRTQDSDHYRDAFSVSNVKSAPADSDNDGMPDYWESLMELNPSVQDHNGLQLSKKITGIEGYTNIECYLNCLSDALTDGQSTGNCRIQLSGTSGIQEQLDASEDILIFPNPTQDIFTVKLSHKGVSNGKILITDGNGRFIQSIDCSHEIISISTYDWPQGIYFIQYTDQRGKISFKKISVQKI
jgi:pectate lyase